MNLKWKRDGFIYYGYNEDNGQLLASIRHNITNGHYSATLIPLSKPYEPYGEWIDMQSAMDAVISELKLREENNESISQ